MAFSFPSRIPFPHFTTLQAASAETDGTLSGAAALQLDRNVAGDLIEAGLLTKVPHYGSLGYQITASGRAAVDELITLFGGAVSEAEPVVVAEPIAAVVEPVEAPVVAEAADVVVPVVGEAETVTEAPATEAAPVEAAPAAKIESEPDVAATNKKETKTSAKKNG